MHLHHVRVQHPVGQGFFHTGTVEDSSGGELKYVVDCGAMARYAAARDREVDQIIRSWANTKPIDFLFVSHAHADHINGIPRLLDVDSGLRVDTIVLPLLDEEERLIAFARTSSEDPTAASSTFYRDFIAEPVTALERFQPAQILFVESGQGDGRAPFSGQDGPDGRDPGGTDQANRQEHNWKLVGRGVLRQVDTPPAARSGAETAASDGRTVRTSAMPDTLGVIVPFEDDQQWLLVTYVDPMVTAERGRFLRGLAKILGTTVPTLKRKLQDPAYLRQLLTTRESELRQAYAGVESDLNLTTLCLYSGVKPPPLTHRTHKPRQDYPLYWGRFGRLRLHGTLLHRTGWLGTGDAQLKHMGRRTRLFEHYGALLNVVQTMTLPHHGSEHNFSAEVLTHVQPEYLVAAADKFSKWRHPGTGVVQAAASSGRTVSTVTSSEASRVEEVLSLFR